jgi:hypothetical protein
MPKKCVNCGGTITNNEEVEHCDNCKAPYHVDCMPDKCVKCKDDTY